MLKLVVFCLFFFSAWTKVCGSLNEKVINGQGITIEQQVEFTKSFNIYRNGVALGEIRNWDNKGMTASLMNYIEWDSKLAAIAQECTNSCPKYIHSECKIPVQNGRTFLIHTISISSDVQQYFNIDALVKQWAKELDLAKQFQQGDLTHFGCGIVQLHGQIQADREIVLCVFDKNVMMNSFTNTPIYQGGPVGSKCPNGLMNPYKGLCKQ